MREPLFTVDPRRHCGALSLSLSVLTVGLLLCASIVGAVGESHSVLVAQRSTEMPQLITEEFDPRPFREDLLLIKPLFAPPRIEEPAPVESVPEPTEAENVGDSADDVLFEEEIESPEVEGRAVFRVQVVALSREAAAAVLSGELELLLDLPVAFEPQGRLYAVRAGEFDAYEDAERLRDRIAAMKSDYREAFVRPGRLSPADMLDDLPDADMGYGPELAASADFSSADEEEPVPDPPELVKTDGWRILINQFLSWEEATELKRQAMRRLRRSDIIIDFKEPYYKVQVGSYRTAPEAQEATDRIKRRGYRNALKVRVLVLLPKEKP